MEHPLQPSKQEVPYVYFVEERVEALGLTQDFVLVKAGLKMKRYDLKIAGLLVLCCLTATRPGYAEKADEKHDTKQGGISSSSGNGGSRPTADKPKASENFDDLIKILDDQKDGATIVYNLKKDAETELASITLDGGKILELKKQVQAVKKYAENLLKCGDASNEDKVSTEMLKSLNDFITFVTEQKAVGKFESKGTLNEKELNTFVVRIQKALEDKATKFKDGSKDFQKADKDLNDQLVAMAKLLQGGSWDKKIVDEEKIDADAARKAIKDASAETKMCKLDELSGDTTSSVSTEGTPQTGNPAPPVADPTVPGTGIAQQPAINGGTPADPSAGGFVNNQLRDALDALRRAEDDRLRERELQDEFLRSQLDQNNLNNDQALRALQGALNQAQRPNVSRGNSDRSEQGPQLSPSVSVPQGQQQPFQQMQPMQMPQMQPMPFNPFMNNGPAQPMMPYTPSRFADDTPRPVAAVQQDPTTSALLQTMQQQNQMFQQMMMNRYPYMGPGVQNVNGMGSVGQALQNFGGLRYSRGGSATSGPRLLPSRFRGNARGGIQGRMGLNPSARGPVPTRLSR